MQQKKLLKNILRIYPLWKCTYAKLLWETYIKQDKRRTKV